LNSKVNADGTDTLFHCTELVAEIADNSTELAWFDTSTALEHPNSAISPREEINIRFIESP
jgi:hypothetical protein